MKVMLNKFETSKCKSVLIIVFASLCFFFCSLGISIAQVKKTEVPDSLMRQNEISVVITDLIDGSLQVRYERKVGDHISAGLGVAFKSKSGLLSISGIDKEHIKTGDITYSGLKLIPDVRYYLNNTQQYALDGFYFGAYSKYFHFSSDLHGTYINDEMESFDINFDAKINVFSVGLMIGYKLAINNRLNVDFMILGPGTSNQSYKLIPKSQIPEEFYEDLNEALENFSMFDLIHSDFRFNFKRAETRFSTFSFRYGITVGYTF